MTSTNNPRDVMAWFEAKVNRITDRGRKVVKELAEDGADLTRHHIETRGTEKSGKAGRIDTGQMIDSVESAVIKDSEDETVTRFGFNDAPYWTTYQEYGTQTIEPMYALVDAAEAIEKEMKREFGKAVRNS